MGRYSGDPTTLEELRFGSTLDLPLHQRKYESGPRIIDPRSPMFDTVQGAKIPRNLIDALRHVANHQRSIRCQICYFPGSTGQGRVQRPGAGWLMAELVAAKRPVVDPTPFRYSHILDNTRPQSSPLA